MNFPIIWDMVELGAKYKKFQHAIRSKNENVKVQKGNILYGPFKTYSMDYKLQHPQGVANIGCN